ncbi:chemotaxis protein [Izhakiella australiensis]|uniref:Chemotaxis protein n=1 Tax=Izhakiella australiensis TaxID=1926881 RepID=A0A1S8YNB9_9GAMM|nr:methyl-accepting chemotaxis protein [Izhakiella australiensis]OON40570.1 chemotaxis protein [Izhakiella australiensis]
MTLTIRTRLIAIVGLLCLLLTITAIWGIFGLREANLRADAVYRNELLPLQSTSRLYRQVQQQSATLFETLRYWTDSDEVNKRLAQIHQYTENIQRERAAYGRLPMVPGAAEISRQFLSELDGWQSSLNEAGEQLRGGNPSAALVIIETRLSPGSQRLQSGIDRLDSLMRQHAESNYAQSVDSYQLARNCLIAMLAGGLAVSLIAGWMLVRSISRSVERARQLASAIANGHIGHGLNHFSHDEMGQLMRALADMDNHLSGIVRDVSESAVALDDAARQMATGNDDLAERTHSQSSALEQTAASMEQMTATVKHNADNAAEADELAKTVRTQAERGSEVLNSAVQAMREIESSSKKIADINHVIDEIAFQTNLLALNAAVEAARAGEQGRGFAVVASEVRQLAQRSAKAAQEIKTLISASVSKVDAGSNLVLRSGEMLGEINLGVERVVSIIGEIAVASRQQSSGIGQVNIAITQMDTNTQQNATLVQQATSASQTVSQHAGLLVHKMAFFQLNEAAAPEANNRDSALPAAQPATV